MQEKERILLNYLDSTPRIVSYFVAYRTLKIDLATSYDVLQIEEVCEWGRQFFSITNGDVMTDRHLGISFLKFGIISQVDISIKN